MTNDRSPKVSVVIPCYNQGHLLDEAVDSVLVQTYSDFEIIVVNDGSDDPSTVQLLKDYDKPNTRVVHTENQGLASARNNGIREAQGEYILPLDADDRIGPGYLADAVRVLDGDPEIGIVYCEAEYFGEKSGSWELPEFDQQEMLLHNLIFCSGFFRKQDWERVGGYNPNMTYGWEDWDFWLSLLELGRKVHRLPEVHFFYRVTATSMIGGMSGEREARMRLRLIDNHWDLFKEITLLEVTPKIVQLFVDTGSGFREQDAISRVIVGDETELTFDLREGVEMRLIRFDPCDDYSVVRIRGIQVETEDRRRVDLEVHETNALHVRDGLYLFATSDPWVTVLAPEESLKVIRFELEYVATGMDAYRYLLERSHKVLLEQGEEIRSQKTKIQTQQNRIEILENRIRENENKIALQERLIQAKDVHIGNIEAELHRIHSMFAWRIINMMRLLKRSVETVRKEGFRALRAKTRNYLRRRSGRRSLDVFEKDYERWAKATSITAEKKAEIAKDVASFAYCPKISMVMPVYNVAGEWLEKAIDSVLAQIYRNWELCIADDASTEAHVREILQRYDAQDQRIKVTYLQQNCGISLASNEALSLATGEFVALLDNDDELTPDALYENVKLLNTFPDADMIYSDEDKLDAKGARCEPHFKPDWSPDMFLSHNYTCHLGVYRKTIVDEIGGFRKGYEGSQDYDLVLRFIEKTDRIHHIPKVLYHWRIIPGSAAKSTRAKTYAYAAGKRALADYLARNGIQGEVEDGLFLGSFRVRRWIDGKPSVTIVIPFKDQASVLKTCVYSILDKTTYPHYRILLVNNGSVEMETLAFLKDIVKNENVRTIDYPQPFNFSAINNFAVSSVDSEIILFLNNDTEVISPDWLESMLEHAHRPEIGCVGALLYYPDDTVQHAGVILGMGGIAGHSHSRCHRDSFGYMGRMKVINNLSAVTAACMMMRRSVFEEVGGYDENISHAFNDVDLCMKIREKGYRIVYTPYAELYHHESLSRGYEDTPEKQKRFVSEVDYISKRWGPLIEKGDPYYNPNMSLKNSGWTVE